MRIRADLHLHTCYSRDSVNSPETIIRRARERRIDVVAVTDHNTTDGWAEMTRVAQRMGFPIILGEEVRIWENGLPIGELVCLFLKEPVQPGSLEDVVRQIRDQNALATVAHPYSFRRFAFRRLELVEQYPDLLIEARNGRTYSAEANRRALELASRLRRGITAGSDAHAPGEVGSVWVEVDARDVESLKLALSNGAARPGGEPSSPLYTLVSGVLGRAGVRL